MMPAVIFDGCIRSVEYFYFPRVIESIFKSLSVSMLETHTTTNKRRLGFRLQHFGNTYDAIFFVIRKHDLWAERIRSEVFNSASGSGRS